MSDTNPPPEDQAPSALAAVGRALDALCQPGRTTTQSQLAADIIASLEVAGYVIVPLEPTEEMLYAGGHAPPPEGSRVNGRAWILNRWRAMVGARPR